MKDWRLSRRSMLMGAALPQTAPPVSGVDSDGALLIKGRRTFLHGLYQLPNLPEALKAAGEAGFQVVHGSNEADLDAAASRGMYRWMTVGSAAAKIEAMVGQYGGHPALLFWETEDEPSYQWKKAGPRVSPEVIRAAYALLRKLDPGRAVYLNHPPTNLVSTLQTYNPGGDILGTDIYPVIPKGIRELYALWPDGRHGDLLNPYISQVGRYMDKLREVAGPRRSAVMVLQAFAWENLRDKDRDPKMVLYPTRDELRFMALHSITRGANGLLWWGLQYTPREAGLWEDLAAVTRELRALDEELAAPSLPVRARLEYHDTGHSLDRGVEWVVKPSKGGPVMIAVNADPNPVEVTIHEVLGAPRRVRFEAFGARVMRAAN
ncbi:MAG: hypothetical protein HZB13_02230 [Acidobacteria bacterium]|nr:hypothetical protein [Acidobacteriota bacterium]